MKKGKGMARKTTVNRSQAIRDFLNTNKAATGSQIVEGLKQQGIKVSLGLANQVKYATQRGQKSSAGRPGRPVGGKSGVTGTESIRQYIAKNPHAGPKQIEDDLRASGIKVSHSLVTAVKYSKKTPSGRRGRPPKSAFGTRTDNRGLVFEDLVEAKKLVDSLGGVDLVRSALEALERLK